ncbi:MAG: SseB family protein [Erysipelotrichaceae bacterium]|nr:SseB family protein [Erysipelotrichaceae bacterium]
MDFKETGFRALYKNFTVFMINDDLRFYAQTLPDAYQADSVLTYGYIDEQRCLRLEILSLAKRSGNRFHFFDPDNSNRMSVGIETLKDQPFFYFKDDDGSLHKRYAKKIEALEKYAVSENLETTRYMTFLDEFRDEVHIDDVKVQLTRKGLKPETVPVRLTDIGAHSLVGYLLEEPKQNFGFHKGESIAFFVQKRENGTVILMTDMTPSMELTEADLADGKLLKKAVHTLYVENNQDHFIDVMEFLRDSYVWVPCTAVLSEADMQVMEKALKEADGDLSKLQGMEFSTKDEVRMEPDILLNQNKYYLPVFSAPEEMGEYGEHFSKVQKHILEVIPLARNNEKQIAGIVLNPFGEAFILEERFFELIEQMKTRLKMN